MPRITAVGPESRGRLVRKGRGHAQLRPYLEAIATLAGDQVLEIEPEPGETMRLIRTRVTRASRQVGKALTCGTTQEGTLLIWLADAPKGTRRRRRTADQPQGADLPDPQGEMLP